MLLTADAERRYVRAILAAVGASDAEASAFADAIVEADLRGYGSHGLLRVPETVANVRDGLLRVGTRPHVQEERPAAALMDGDRALGPYAAVAATREAIARARRTGTGAVALYNCGHIAMAGYYVELAAREDLIGILMTKGNPAVHPHGGLDRQIGTNPISIGIPTAGDPFLLDMATSATSLGALREAVAAGRPVAEGLAVDRSGAPTTDPAAALAGALSPVGGAKGYGLGLVVELLAGALTRAGAGVMRDARGRRKLWGTLVLVLDPAAFANPAAFKAAASAYLAEVKASALAPGFCEILVPGERAFRTRRAQLAHGVRITDGIWDEVAQVARGLGIEPDAYLAQSAGGRPTKPVQEGRPRRAGRKAGPETTG